MGKAKALVPLVGLVGLIATLSPSTAAASELFPPLTWEGTVTSQDYRTGYFPGDSGGWTSTASVVWKLIPNLNHRRPADEYEYELVRVRSVTILTNDSRAAKTAQKSAR
jgi:hypothetical protein